MSDGSARKVDWIVTNIYEKNRWALDDGLPPCPAKAAVKASPRALYAVPMIASGQGAVLHGSAGVRLTPTCGHP
jgi:hypothetical protein